MLPLFCLLPTVELRRLYLTAHMWPGRMSGIIRLVGSDGNPVQANGTPPALPPLYQPDEFDTACGTYEASPFAAGATPDKCPGQTFLCSEMESEFGKCMHAIDCKMNYEVRRGLTGE